MRISEVARLAGVSVKTVRYYESVGIIEPVRLPNGYRDYTEHHLRLVHEARALNGLGIPVERTRPFLDCLASGHEHADDCPAALAGYRDAIAELDERIAALTARRDLLVRHLHQAAHRNSRAPGGNAVRADLYQLSPNLPVPEDDGAADHLPGAAMPPLELTDTSGNAVRLDGLGEGRSVIYCFPLIGSPDADLPEGWDTIPGARGCTPESCGFRDHYGELTSAGATHVYGLSSQDVEYQQEVVERLHLPFGMLSDAGFALAEALRLPTFEAGGIRLYKRFTLVVRDGRVEHVFYPVFPPDEHAEQVLAWLHDHP